MESLRGCELQPGWEVLQVFLRSLRQNPSVCKLMQIFCKACTRSTGAHIHTGKHLGKSSPPSRSVFCGKRLCWSGGDGTSARLCGKSESQEQEISIPGTARPGHIYTMPGTPFQSHVKEVMGEVRWLGERCLGGAKKPARVPIR